MAVSTIRKTTIREGFHPPDFKLGLFPFHSPLLGKSRLVSFPLLSNMLKFSRYPCPNWESVGKKEAFFSFVLHWRTKENRTRKRTTFFLNKHPCTGLKHTKEWSVDAYKWSKIRCDLQLQYKNTSNCRSSDKCSENKCIPPDNIYYKQPLNMHLHNVIIVQHVTVANKLASETSVEKYSTGKLHWKNHSCYTWADKLMNSLTTKSNWRHSCKSKWVQQSMIHRRCAHTMRVCRMEVNWDKENNTQLGMPE